jgi:uncharacterized SAM-binding protein YcdF (DUF218 family)
MVLASHRAAGPVASRAMFDYLLRQATLLIQPVGLVWLGLLIFTVAFWRRKARGWSVVAGLLAAVVTLVGSTDFAGWLLRGLERPWAEVDLATLPAADAVLVLGGGTEPARHEAGGVHFTKAGDRVILGVELVRLGKAKVLVLGGGGADFDGQTVAEADRVKAWLESWKVPGIGEVLSLGVSANTHEEGEKLAQLAKARGWSRVLLVTSANHMNRATGVFRAVGVEAIPAPCNFLTTLSTAPSPFQLSVPQFQGFEKFGIWLHEKVGTAVYQRRGWVK